MTTSTFDVLTSSKTDEWYTPKAIINSARQLMGGIDIDPTSNLIAQQWIQAKVYYRKHQDGFSKSWYGRLWLNPPYSKKDKKKNSYGAGAWFNKAYVQYRIGNVTEGLALGRGDSDGIRLLTQNCYFVDCDRIAFIAEDGITSDKPIPGYRLFYLGINTDGFIDLFRPYGTILRAV